MAVKKEKVIIMSSALEHVLSIFVPQFGNEEDLSIAYSLSKLRQKLGTVDNKAFRDLELKKDQRAMTGKMREIMRDESNLIYRINKRNLDF